MNDALLRSWGLRRVYFEVHLPSLPPPPTIANFDLKIVPKNCDNFVLNCAAIFKFCDVHLFVECCVRGELWKRQLPSPIANFYFKMVSNNFANFVLNCAAIFKFCAAPFPEISPKDALRTALPLQIFSPKWCQKLVLIFWSIVLQFLNFVCFTFLQNAGKGVGFEDISLQLRISTLKCYHWNGLNGKK